MRIGKQQEIAHKQLQTQHGVAVLRKTIGVGRDYEYIVITTPPGHSSHHKKPVQTDDDNKQIKELLRKIHSNENSERLDNIS